MTANRIFGLIFLLAGITGFLTVADDLRHTGEIAGVAGILLCGLLLLSGGFAGGIGRNLPVRWMAGGILAGMAAGAATDSMIAGELAGFAAGCLAGFTAGAFGRRKNKRDTQ